MIIKTSYPFMKPPPSARLIRGHRLAQGLAGLWLFGENGGLQVFDLSGNGNEGTLQGDVVWVPGKHGPALDFPGLTGDYVQSAKSVGGWSEITIIASIKSEEEVDGGLVSIGVPATNFDWFTGFRVDTPTQIRAILGNGVDSYKLRNSSTGSFPVDGSFTHIAMTARVADAYPDIYINGVLDNSSQVSDGTPAMNTGILYIGAGVKGEADCVIEYVMIYNRALSAFEIAELYLRPFGMFERKARTALMSGYVIPPVGNAGIMTTNTCYWGPTF